MLKRKFSALIPAFDPRPGRTNVNQTSDLEVPAPNDGNNASTAEPAAPIVAEETKSGLDERKKSEDRESPVSNSGAISTGGGAGAPKVTLTLR